MVGLKKNIDECYSHENISLKLDSYDDIFSSFDPRPYSERALSVDFLGEAKRASIDKPSGDIELRLILPKNIRKPEVEKTIQSRLKTHFDKHTRKVNEQHKKTIRNGILSTIFGVVIMIVATFLLYDYSESNLLIHFLIILFEPAGWFLFWEGLDQVVFESKKNKPELEFYQKMAKTDIIFMSC